MIRTRVTGAAQLERRMRKLSAAAQHRVLREAVEAGSEPIVRSAKGRAPSADIAEGVRLINVLRKARAVVAEIGLPGGRRKWFHGLFIELGTGPRVQKATGQLEKTSRVREVRRDIARIKTIAAEAAAKGK